MKHFGDITKIDGHKVPLVDIVTGGSPCQDLSVAGKRAGLQGERSGLFMEQIRIIKEMRDESKRRADRYIRPRFMVFENVPGLLSSNNGEDFRVVLEETARVVEPSAIIPRYEGGWTNSGVVLGREWSIAWRIHDLQFWGCPQRRCRVSLIADFGGQTAPEVLFERKSLSGDIDPSEEAREGTPEVIGRDLNQTISFQERAGREGGVKVYSFNQNGQEHCRPSTTNTSSDTKVYGISPYSSNSMKSDNPHSGIYEADSARTLDLNGANPNCNQGGMMIVEPSGVAFRKQAHLRTADEGQGWENTEVNDTLNNSDNTEKRTPTLIVGTPTYSQDSYDELNESDNAASLKASGGNYGGGSETLVISESDRSLMCERR